MADMDRREFMKAAGGCVATAGGVSSLMMLLNMGESYKYRPIYQQSQKIVNMKGGGQDFLLRPPGARGDEDFLSKCIKCYLCVEACPVQAIKIAGREHGESSDTPYIIPEITGCDLCLTRDKMKCNDICPTDALEKIDNQDIKKVQDKLKLGEEMNMGIALLDKRICYPWIGISACWACYEICPYKGSAIKVGDKRAVHAANAPNFFAEHCVGCGLCVEVCPVPQKAIRMVSQGDTDVVDMAAQSAADSVEGVTGKTAYSSEGKESRTISDTIDFDDIKVDGGKGHEKEDHEEHGGKGKKKDDGSWDPSTSTHDVLKF